jgi:hypothetical protein
MLNEIEPTDMSVTIDTNHVTLCVYLWIYLNHLNAFYKSSVNLLCETSKIAVVVLYICHMFCDLFYSLR